MTATLTQIARFMKKPEKKPAEAPADVTVMPAFMPARMAKGEGVLEVTTRQKFLTEGYQVWLLWHWYRALAIFFAVLTLILITFNLWLAGGSALAASHFYSEHVRQALRIQKQYKVRRMLYTR